MRRGSTSKWWPQTKSATSSGGKPTSPFVTFARNSPTSSPGRCPARPGNFHAAPAYIDRHGRPETVDDLAESVFVATGDVTSYLKAIQPVGLPVTRANMKYVSDSGIVAWEMVKQGLGMCIMTHEVAALTPEVEQVLPDFPPLPVPIWLVTHRELRTSRRIRAVFDLLAEAFAERGMELSGSDG
ncbi:MAG: LysR substrate-binding domain-containing protein, partial [Alphaproteobacteria bacterium]